MFRKLEKKKQANLGIVNQFGLMEGMFLFAMNAFKLHIDFF